MQRRLVYLFLVSGVVLFLFAASLGLAEDEISFNKDTSYDIYYEVSEFEVDNVDNVKISGVTPVGDSSFLVITGSDFGSKDKQGYILLNRIRAMLPHGLIRPKRTLNTEAED